MRLLVLSGADHIRFPTMINHKLYSDRNGYRYRFDLSPTADIKRPFFHKLAKIDDALGDADWLFWMDDDVAFTQLHMAFEQLVPELSNPDVHAIFCKSPVNLQGGWTYISSGVFFLRNSPVSRRLLSMARESLLPTVRAWWDGTRFGMFTNGDQDILTYLITTDAGFSAATTILGYERFNTRPYHFERAEEHFLVHFTHQPGKSKSQQMQTFAARFGLTPFLVAEEDLAAYGDYPMRLSNMVRTRA